MSNYIKEIQDVYMKHGSGPTNLASAIIHLTRENNELRENYNRVIKEQQESFENIKEVQAQFRDGTWHGHTTKDYTDSVSVDPDEGTSFFSLAYQWQDKKHRHVFDLCDWINKLQDELKEKH